MLRPTLEIDGKRYVLLEESEYRELSKGSRSKRKRPLGSRGHLDAQEYVPALPFLKASIARDIIRGRKAARLTQEQLAKLSGLRVETICRLENGSHSPTVRTVERIQQALRRPARNSSKN